MNRLLTIILIVLFSYSLLGQTKNDIPALVTALLADTPVQDDLRQLCDEIGGRITGSEANELAVKWAIDKFKVAGVSVSVEEFTMPTLWLEKSTTCQIYGDIDFIPQIVSKYHSPPGLIQSKLFSVGAGTRDDFEKYGAALRDHVVIVETGICDDIHGLFAEYGQASIVEDLARAYHVKAVVFQSSRPHELLYTFVTKKGVENDLPQFVMSREDAKRCLRSLAAGHSLDIQLKVDALTGDSFASHNAIGEIKGSEYPNEVILIGSHLDSWGLGTGANDNGCNVSILIDIARQMTALDIKPKRTIRFALWNGEEQGFFGSWAYTKDHQSELADHKVAMSIDIGSGPINGFFTNGRGDLIPILDQVLKPVRSLGPYHHINVPVVGTDNLDFMLHGIPNMVASHEPSLYGYNYHASSDTYDKVDFRALKINSAILGAVVLGMANMDGNQLTLNHQTRAQIGELFETHNTEKSMRMFNVWEPWVDGKRGKK